MLKEDLFNSIVSSYCNQLKLEQIDSDSYAISLPYRNYDGDLIEIGINIKDGQREVNDLGNIAGLLFSLDQHGFSTPAHRFVQSITNDFNIKMDYNEGILRQKLLQDNIDEINEFIKVIITLNSSIPYLRVQKKHGKRRQRLAIKLGKEIKQLTMPMHVDRQVLIHGSYLDWNVEYRYFKERINGGLGTLIKTADLLYKEPQEKASTIISLATDIQSTRKPYDLRIVYELDDVGFRSQSYKAAQFIEDHKEHLKYRTFNYSDEKQRLELHELVNKELLTKVNILDYLNLTNPSN